MMNLKPVKFSRETQCLRLYHKKWLTLTCRELTAFYDLAHGSPGNHRAALAAG